MTTQQQGGTLPELPADVQLMRSKLAELFSDCARLEDDCDTCFDEPDKNPALATALSDLAKWLQVSAGPSPALPLSVFPARAKVIEVMRSRAVCERDCDTCFDEPHKNPALERALYSLADRLCLYRYAPVIVPVILATKSP